MPLTRRALLVSLGGVGAAVATGAVIERGPIDRHLIRTTPEPATSVPSAATGPIVSGSFKSAARGGRDTGWSIAYPPGADEKAQLPVALVLHGRSNSHHTAFGSHELQRFLAGAVHTGTPPFALASVDGGDHSYWHRRANGDDPQAMILTEFMPMLASRGLRTGRIGLSGWSMGGYGALLLAEHLGSQRCAAVAVDSPALWLHPGDSAPGAFDNRADFVSHDVVANARDLSGIPVRIAIGTSDPFYSATKVFGTKLPSPPTTAFGPGGHDVAFWRHAALGQLQFLGKHLA
jgi:enterochelin esterase-like enzyme